MLVTYLKWWDQAATHRPDKLVTLSNKVASKIKKQYGLNAEIIYPPVKDLSDSIVKPSNLFPANLSDIPPFLLSVSRLVEYKRVDLAIQTSLQIKVPLMVVGAGVDLSRLQSLAGKEGWTKPSDMNFETAIKQLRSNHQLISFFGHVTEQELIWLYQHAQTLLSLGDDDFGLVPLEAAQFALSSVISSQSGVAEILKFPQLAVHINKPTVSAVISALEQIKEAPPKSKYLIEVSKKQKDPIFINRMTKMVYHDFHH